MSSFHFVADISLLLLLIASLTQVSMGARRLTSLYQPKADLIKYHKGTVLRGDIPISIVWYGNFTHPQKSIISDFILSLTPKPQALPRPSVHQWWEAIEKLYLSKAAKRRSKPKKASDIFLSSQVSDEKCSMGKSLKLSQVSKLAAVAGRRMKGGIALVLTSEDVDVEGFCMSRCGLHGSNRRTGLVYIWVGNSVAQCPGQCAWPFHQPVYGPGAAPLLPPNGEVGADAMVIRLASLLAGAVTNPYGDGFFKGAKGAPVEAATACPGVYAKGAYPGYAGKLLVDRASGASYNAKGVNGRKYVVPALFDPSKSTCSTLV